MSLNNQDDNNQSFDQEFSEEQNFDNDPAVLAATQGISSKGKGGWLIILIGIVGVGAYMGYRYYLVPHGSNIEMALPSANETKVSSASDKLNRQAHKNAQFERLKTSLFDSSETTKTTVAVPPPAQPINVTTIVPATAPAATVVATHAPAPVAAVKTETVTVSPAPVAQPAENPASISDAVHQVAQLNERLEVNIHQIQHLEEVLQGITQTISKLNTDINAMDNRLLALSNSTGNLSSDMGTIKHEMSSVKKVLGEEGVLDINVPPSPSHTYLKASQLASARAKTSIPAYVVHAIIPGRAWLKAINGQITTVTEGDTLGDYGKVLVIDAASGMVLTGSGNTFQ